MPIASVRQIIKKGNELDITPNGGTIRTRKTGETIRLHKRDGVYIFKMSFSLPHRQHQPSNDAVKNGPNHESLGLSPPT